MRVIERKTLAIIPARGGSKGIPRKNLQLLAGAPLVVHAIHVAMGAASIKRVVVSTDDKEIAAVAGEAGAEVIMRPPRLADDVTPTIEVLQHAINTLGSEGWQPELVALLEPTSPFRTSALVDTCMAKFDDPAVRSVVTVTQLERNPFNIFVVKGDRAERFLKGSEMSFTQRQQFSHLKRINGCVYAARAESIRVGRLLEDPIRVVEMPSYESINIDEPFDLEIARFVAKQYRFFAGNPLCGESD